MGYKLLASAKSSEASSPGYYMEFTNIDQGYDDLLVKGWFQSNHSVGQLQTIFKLGTSTTGYSRGWYVFSNGTMSRQSDGSQRMTVYSYGSSGGGAYREVFFENRIPRYSDTNYYKNSMNLSYSGANASYGDLEGTATIQTANKYALTDLTIQMAQGYSIVGDSQWWLYGIKNS